MCPFTVYSDIKFNMYYLSSLLTLSACTGGVSMLLGLCACVVSHVLTVYIMLKC